MPLFNLPLQSFQLLFNDCFYSPAQKALSEANDSRGLFRTFGQIFRRVLTPNLTLQVQLAFFNTNDFCGLFRAFVIESNLTPLFSPSANAESSFEFSIPYHVKLYSLNLYLFYISLEKFDLFVLLLAFQIYFYY